MKETKETAHANEILLAEAEQTIHDMKNLIEGIKTQTGRPVRSETIRMLKYRMFMRNTQEMGYFIMNGSHEDVSQCLHALDDIISIKE